MVVVAVLAVELGVEDADLGLAGAVEAQRHQSVGQPLAVATLVEVSEQIITRFISKVGRRPIFDVLPPCTHRQTLR